MTVSSETLRSISAPEQLETRLGTLEFVDGVPSGEAAEKVYDHLDFVHALNVYLDGFAAASTYAIRKGFHEAGVEDNPIIIFSELMGSESVFLTANADTVYFLGVVDLTSGPMVVETPPQALGVIDDMWWGWIIDFGLPGPDRGEGGRFLLVPPGYDGPLPDSGYHVGHSRTSRALMLGALVPDGRRPGADRRDDQEHAEDLPLRAGRRRHERGDAARGRRVQPAAAGGGSRDGVRGGKRERVQHGAAERLRLLRADERGGAGRARRQHQPRADGAAGRDRDRQGPAVRAGRADARASSRTRPPSATRPRGRCSSTSRARRSSRTTTTLGVVQHAVGRRLHVRDAAAARHEGGDQAVPRDRRPEAPLPDVVPLRGHRSHAGDVHAAHRPRVAVPHGRQGRRRKPPSTARRPTR